MAGIMMHSRYQILLGQDPATQLIFAMATKPDAARETLVRALINQMRADGVWQKLGLFYIPAAHAQNAAGLNWPQPRSFPLALVNSPSFTIDRGFASDGVASYEDTGWAAAIDAVLFQRDAAHIGMVSLTAASGGTTGDAGSGSSTFIRAYDGANTRFRVNGLANLSATQASGTGHFIATRRDANNTAISKDGAAGTVVTGASGALSDNKMLINATLAAGPYSTKTIACFHLGAALTDAEIAALYNAVLTYRTAIGAI